LSQYRDAYAIESLAAAYAEAGKFEDAARLQQRLVTNGPERHRAEASARLKLYQSQKPYRFGENKAAESQAE